MKKTKKLAALLGGLMLAPALVPTLAPAPAMAAENVLNIYNWVEYIGPNVIPGFEKETGIKVNYDTFDANETLEAKLSAGRSGYDIVVPTLSPFLARGAKAGLYQAIDKTKLSNFGNIDPSLLQTMAKLDPGNNFAIPWVTAIDAIGYNAEKIAKIDPNVPVDSLRMIFDPEVVSKFKSCGVTVLDSPTDIIPMALFSLGKDPNSESLDDLKAASDLLFKIRPYIRKFDSSGYINGLANGDVCLSFGWSTDIAIAGRRAKEAGKKHEVKLVIPKEGSLTYIDSLAIPTGAPNLENAYKFLDYIMRPEVSADTSNEIGGRTGNVAALPLINPEYTSNPGLFPAAEMQAKLFTLAIASKDFERQRTRAWTKIKTGR